MFLGDHPSGIGKHDEHAVQERERLYQVRIHNAWVDDNTSDAGVPMCQFSSVEQVRQLRLAVPRPARTQERGEAFLLGVERVECNAFGGVQPVALRREGHDANIGTRALGGAEHDRQEQLQQCCMTHVVGSKLDLVSVARESGRYCHDAGAGDEHVQTVRAEELDGCFDGLAGAEIALQEGDLNLGRDGPHRRQDLIDALSVAPGEVYVRRVVLCKAEKG